MKVRVPLKGMDENERAELGSAEVIVDMRRDGLHAWESTGGFEALGSSVGDGDVVPFLTWLVQHNGGRRWLVYERGAAHPCTLAYHNLPGGLSSAIDSSRTFIDGPWQGTQSFQSAGWLYLFNGYDRAKRWNGRAYEDVGFESPPAPPQLWGPSEGFEVFDTCSFNFGAAPAKVPPQIRGVGTASETAATSWEYVYAVSDVSDTGMESPCSSPVAIIGENIKYDPAFSFTGLRSIRVRIPRAASSTTRGRRLYRSKNVFGADVGVIGAVTLYLHSEFPGAGEQEIHDDRPDRELGSELDRDSTGTIPGGAKFAKLFKGTCFLAGMPEFPDRLRYSAPLFIEQFPAQNYLVIGSQEAGEITGMKEYKNALVVFKRRGIYLVRGDPVSGFSVETVTEDVGSCSPNALVDVPGAGLLFLNADGPYLLVGALENEGVSTVVRFVGNGLKKTWRRRVAVAHLISAHAVVNHSWQEVWIQVPESGGWRPTLGLVLHYAAGAIEWSLREGWPAMRFAETPDQKFVVFGTSDVTRPIVNVITDGALTKGGTALSSVWESSWIDQGPERAPVAKIEPFVGNQNRAFTVSYRVDRQRTARPTNDVALRSVDTEQARPLWDSAVWGTDLWTDYDPVLMGGFDLYDGNCFELKLRMSAARMRVIDLLVSVRDQPRPEKMRG